MISRSISRPGQSLRGGILKLGVGAKVDVEVGLGVGAGVDVGVGIGEGVKSGWVQAAISTQVNTKIQGHQSVARMV
jgi:hypothetical protein